MKNSKLKSKQIITAAFAVALFVFSCKKDNNPSDSNVNEAVAVAVNHQAASRPFNETLATVFGQLDDLGADLARMQNGRPDGNARIVDGRCYEVTVSPAHVYQWPKTVTWDFGEGCVGIDGKTRKGKVISVFTGILLSEGAKVTTTFDGYQVDSFKVTGSLDFTNQFSYSPDTIYAFKTQYTNATATHALTGYWTKLNGTITYQLVKQSPNYFNPAAAFTSTGTLHGENALGFTWTAETTVPVLRNHTCLWPISGIISLEWNDHSDKAFIDYGTGSCDNQAEVSYKGFKKAVSL